MKMVDKLMLYVGSHFGTDDATVLTMHKPKKTKLSIVPSSSTTKIILVHVPGRVYFYIIL